MLPGDRIMWASKTEGSESKCDTALAVGGIVELQQIPQVPLQRTNRLQGSTVHEYLSLQSAVKKLADSQNEPHGEAVNAEWEAGFGIHIWKELQKGKADVETGVYNLRSADSHAL